MGLIDGDLDILPSGQAHFRGTGRVSAALAPFEHASRRQQLCAMAHRGNGFAGLIDRLDQRQHLFVQAQILRCPAPRNHQRVVVISLDLGKIKVERKVVPGFFAVGLIAFEIVDRSAHRLPGALARAHCMHAMADHLQGLERHHHFVIFNVVANQHQNLLRSHVINSFRCNGKVKTP
ncbi:hypothetical protein D3C76_1173140 [compost metagenome]